MPKKKRITAEKVRQVKEFVREHPSDRNGQVAAWLDLSETTVRLIRNGAYDHLLDERQQQLEKQVSLNCWRTWRFEIIAINWKRDAAPPFIFVLLWGWLTLAHP